MLSCLHRIIVLFSVALLLSAGVNSGSQTCPSSANKAVIASAASCPNSICKATTWTIQAPSANTGKVYIGGSTVATTTGIYLSAGDSAAMFTQGNASPYDLTQVYIACTQAADTITYNFTQ